MKNGVKVCFCFYVFGSAVPKLRVVAHCWVVDGVLVGRESYLKFKLMHALFQII